VNAHDLGYELDRAVREESAGYLAAKVRLPDGTLREVSEVRVIRPHPFAKSSTTVPVVELSLLPRQGETEPEEPRGGSHEEP
jgi:hypothetical protein